MIRRLPRHRYTIPVSVICGVLAIPALMRAEWVGLGFCAALWAITILITWNVKPPTRRDLEEWTG